MASLATRPSGVFAGVVATRVASSRHRSVRTSVLACAPSTSGCSSAARRAASYSSLVRTISRALSTKTSVGTTAGSPYPAGYRIRLRGEIKPVPQEVDVPGWNLLPGYHSAPMRGVRLGPNESLRERGHSFNQNILSRHACLVYKSVGSPCAFDERKEIGIRMAARDVRNGNSGERGRDCGAGREKSAQGGATGGCFRQSSGVCPHGGVGHCGVP